MEGDAWKCTILPAAAAPSCAALVALDVLVLVVLLVVVVAVVVLLLLGLGILTIVTGRRKRAVPGNATAPPAMTSRPEGGRRIHRQSGRELLAAWTARPPLRVVGQQDRVLVLGPPRPPLSMTAMTPVTPAPTEELGQLYPATPLACPIHVGRRGGLMPPGGLTTTPDSPPRALDVHDHTAGRAGPAAAGNAGGRAAGGTVHPPPGPGLGLPGHRAPPPPAPAAAAAAATGIRCHDASPGSLAVPAVGAGGLGHGPPPGHAPLHLGAGQGVPHLPPDPGDSGVGTSSPGGLGPPLPWAPGRGGAPLPPPGQLGGRHVHPRPLLPHPRAGRRSGRCGCGCCCCCCMCWGGQEQAAWATVRVSSPRIALPAAATTAHSARREGRTRFHGTTIFG